MNTLMLAVVWQLCSAMLLNLLEDEEEELPITGRLPPQVWMKVSNNNNNYYNNENNLIIIITVMVHNKFIIIIIIVWGR